ncbi:MAG: hypothetical protein ABIG30_03255 [Candidatus Aenigmatarchaeota archaeon]
MPMDYDTGHEDEGQTPEGPYFNLRITFVKINADGGTPKISGSDIECLESAATCFGLPPSCRRFEIDVCGATVTMYVTHEPEEPFYRMVSGRFDCVGKKFD